MNPNNFWLQLIQRLSSDNPKFFKYIMWASLACSAITGIPELLDFFGVHLTGVWAVLENKSLAVAGLVAALIAKLPNNTPSSPTPTK